jgi:poly-gamma-glutamate capsule biosynthesis protein CapA/YwtB (metallophosphatase superfamily)
MISWGIRAALVIPCLLAIGCAPATPPEPELHRLVYGGDLLLGKQFNFALHDAQSRARIFADIEPVLARSEIRMLNAEGVIAQGGEYFDKADPTPHMFRAHPNAIEVLTKAGFNLVSVGNNHAVDYGREALVEMLTRLQHAGVEYTGGGYDLKDARRPAYVKVGSLSVAIVGANLAQTPEAAATADEPGTWHFTPRRGRFGDETIADLAAAASEARRHADLVFLTPHWGRNWECKPSAETRRIGRELIRAGYDAILGHSAHCLQGAELVDGKPVLYDPSNVGVYWTTDQREWNQGVLYELEFSRAGVHTVRAHPILLRKNQVLRAPGKFHETILAKWQQRSTELGTTTAIIGDAGVLRCTPGRTARAEPLVPAPPRPRPTRIELAPSERQVGSLPAGATTLDVRYANGLRLLGAEVIPAQLSRRNNTAVVSLYWTLERPLSRQLQIVLEARGLGKNGKPRTTSIPHIPGDWIWPTDEWPTGQIIHDRFLMLVRLGPEGVAEILAGVEGLEPLTADRPLVDGRLVPIASLPYVPQTDGVFAELARRRDAAPAAPAAEGP